MNIRAWITRAGGTTGHPLLLCFCHQSPAELGLSPAPVLWWLFGRGEPRCAARTPDGLAAFCSPGRNSPASPNDALGDGGDHTRSPRRGGLQGRACPSSPRLTDSPPPAATHQCSTSPNPSWQPLYGVCESGHLPLLHPDTPPLTYFQKLGQPPSERCEQNNEEPHSAAWLSWSLAPSLGLGNRVLSWLLPAGRTSAG